MSVHKTIWKQVSPPSSSMQYVSYSSSFKCKWLIIDSSLCYCFQQHCFTAALDTEIDKTCSTKELVDHSRSTKIFITPSQHIYNLFSSNDSRLCRHCELISETVSVTRLKYASESLMTLLAFTSVGWHIYRVDLISKNGSQMNPSTSVREATTHRKPASGVIHPC